VQISNFIGREIEIRHINDSLETAALITLTGTGGSGKTRLALQAGAEVIDNFADGVWFIELAELNDGDLLAQVIGRTFGLDENSGNKPDEALIEFLKKKEALLIIDNCEHIIDASAMLTEKLLASCPRLKIISTSREAMKINGEKIIRVDSLTTPDPLELATSETVSQFEAVRLFIDRALAVDSNFQVNNDNAPALAEICHRLDGIPLAIELAAARTKVLPLEKINDRLSDRFKLLTGGKRTVLPRQQTLRAMIDWSYDLLNEDEKLLFRRLSVFAGGWTLEAAEEICSDEYLDSYDLIDILTGLLDKSLITSKDDSENMRFGMLETIRQYAKEMAGDISATREKHSEYFRKITLAADVLEGKIDMIAWAKSIDGDIANIKRAIFRSLKDNSQRAVEMLSSIGEYWVLRGYYREGYITCKKVLEFNEIIDPLQRSMAIYAMGHMASILGNMQESRKLGEECLALSRIAGDKYAIANACSLVGLSHSSSMKHDDESWERYEEALQLFSELGSRYNKASVLYNMSFVAAKRSDKELSQKLKKEALEIYRELKNPVKIALTLTGLGSTELKQGNLEEARTYIQESLTVSEPTKDKYMTSINLVLLGCINSGTGDFDTAQKYFDESLKISKECGYVANIIPTLYHIGDAFFKSGDFDNAGKSYVESIKTGAEREIDFYLVHNIFGLGLIYFAKDDFKRSLTILQIGKKILNGTYGTIGKPKADEADEYIVKNEDILGAKQSESIRSSVDVMSEEEMISFVVES
jgi:non-specific serine/threonine protein kinase